MSPLQTLLKVVSHAWQQHGKQLCQKLQLLLEQGGVGPRASLPQSMKAKMLTAEAAQDERRQVVIAYDATEEGRRMLGWATNYCLATDDELHLVHYQVCLEHHKS